MGVVYCIKCGSRWYGDTFGVDPDTYLCPACRTDEEEEKKEAKQGSLDSIFNK